MKLSIPSLLLGAAFAFPSTAVAAEDEAFCAEITKCKKCIGKKGRGRCGWVKLDNNEKRCVAEQACDGTENCAKASDVEGFPGNKPNKPAGNSKAIKETCKLVRKGKYESPVTPTTEPTPSPTFDPEICTDSTEIFRYDDGYIDPDLNLGLFDLNISFQGIEEFTCQSRGFTTDINRIRVCQKYWIFRENCPAQCCTRCGKDPDRTEPDSQGTLLRFPVCDEPLPPTPTPTETPSAAPTTSARPSSSPTPAPSDQPSDQPVTPVPTGTFAPTTQSSTSATNTEEPTRSINCIDDSSPFPFEDDPFYTCSKLPPGVNGKRNRCNGSREETSEEDASLLRLFCPSACCSQCGEPKVNFPTCDPPPTVAPTFAPTVFNVGFSCVDSTNPFQFEGDPFFTCSKLPTGANGRKNRCNGARFSTSEDDAARLRANCPSFCCVECSFVPLDFPVCDEEPATVAPTEATTV